MGEKEMPTGGEPLKPRFDRRRDCQKSKMALLL